MIRNQITFLALLFAFASSVHCKKSKIIEPFPDNYVGVGLEIEIKDQFPRIVRAIPGGAAQKKGLAAGEYIVEIESEGTRGMPLAVVVDRLRGKDGTTITVGTRKQLSDPTTYVIIERVSMRKTVDGGMSLDGRNYKVSAGNEEKR